MQEGGKLAPILYLCRHNMKSNEMNSPFAKRLIEAWLHFRKSSPNQDSLCPKACFFDMDGVIFDSMPIHAQSWVGATAQYGIRSCEADFYRLEGQIGSETIRQLVDRNFNREASPEEIEGVYKLKTELFVKLEGHEPMLGAAETIEEVRRAGLGLVLVTGSSQSSLLHRLERSYPGVFDPSNMVTGLDVERGKPHPEPYLKALGLLGIQAHEALVVENAPLGIRAARAAGIFTLAVNTGPLPDELLMEAGASVLAADMNEVAEGLRLFFEELRQS